jgi:hypothetical protein
MCVAPRGHFLKVPSSQPPHPWLVGVFYHKGTRLTRYSPQGCVLNTFLFTIAPPAMRCEGDVL